MARAVTNPMFAAALGSPLPDTAPTWVKKLTASPPHKNGGGGGGSGSGLAGILTMLDPFTVPSEAQMQEYTKSRRPWGCGLAQLLLFGCAFYWGWLWRLDTLRPEVVVSSSRATADAPRSLVFTPSALVTADGALVTAFVPNAADALTPCAVAANVSAVRGGVPLDNGTLPLCPFTAGRVLGAPKNDVAGVAVLLQLALACPTFTSPTDDAYVNGVTMAALLAANGVASDARLGTVTYGTSTVPLYARDFQTRFCKPPATAVARSIMTASRHMHDTSAVAVMFAEVTPQHTVFSNGTAYDNVASVTVRAREDDVWDVSGGSAVALSDLPLQPAIASQLVPRLPQLQRRGVYVSTTVSWQTYMDGNASFIAALPLIPAASAPYVTGGIYPYSRASAEAMGNFTMRSLARLVEGTLNGTLNVSGYVTDVYSGAAACALLDAMNVTYTSLNVFGKAGSIWTNNNEAESTLWRTPPGIESLVPTQQAANAARGMGCGLKWRAVAADAAACRVEHTYAVVRISTGVISQIVDRWYGSNVREEAAIACDSGAQLPRALTDDIYVSRQDDVSQLIMETIGAPYSVLGNAHSSVAQAANQTSSNLVITGAGLFTTRADSVQTVVLVLAATPSEVVQTYASTSQGAVTVFSQASGVWGLLYAACTYIKRALLYLTTRRRAPAKDATPLPDAAV